MKKSLLLIFSLLLVFSFVSADSWWDEDFNYRVSIDLTNNEFVDRVDDMVVLEDLSNHFQNAQPDYDDIRIVEGGNEIAYEFFDSYNKLRFVTDVPMISTKEIYVYYGNVNAVAPDYSDCAVWQPCSPLADYSGLVLWYKIGDERSNILDYSGNYMGNTVAMDVDSTDGVGDSFSIISANNDAYLDTHYIENNVSQPDNNLGLTISGWYKLDGGKSYYNGFWGAGNTILNGWGLRTDGVDVIGISNGGQIFRVDNLALQDEEWHYIAETYDRTTSTWSFYVDSDIPMITRTGEYGGTNNRLFFGNTDFTRPYGLKGNMDNLKFYNKVLTEMPIEEIDISFSNEEVFEDIDVDADGVPDSLDNCRLTFNPSQSDLDEDGVGDWCDNCVLESNEDQLDEDENYIGDACENCFYFWKTRCVRPVPIDPNSTILPIRL